MRRLVVVPGALLLALACTQPPTRELQDAEQAVQRAREEGADRYAADRLKEAEAALQDARSQVQARDYRKALSQANAAGERAQAARRAAQQRKEQLAVELGSQLTAIRAGLAAAQQARAAAEDLPAEAFADLDGRLRDLASRGEAFAVLVDGRKLAEAAPLAEPLRLDAQKAVADVQATTQAARVAKTKPKPKAKPRKPARGR
jgi:colicin import membrane protein